MSAMPTTIEVATILSQLRLDTACVTAGLVHGAAEDTEVRGRSVEARFGTEGPGRRWTALGDAEECLGP